MERTRVHARSGGASGAAWQGPSLKEERTKRPTLIHRRSSKNCVPPWLIIRSERWLKIQSAPTALAFERNADAPDDFVFGNLAGQRYTKGGWKKTLSYLMSDCVDAAKAQGRTFEPFNLRDCRPAGVTQKLNNKDNDVMDATLHSSERMLRTHYDRRRTRVAKPAK